jgi:ATP-binding cassette subfamily D (ALD) long-chain fatty acid import protein
VGALPRRRRPALTTGRSPSLSKYHTRVLTLTGDGSWTSAPVGAAAERMERAREIAALEEKLAQMGAWEARVGELEALLGVQELDENGSP